MIKINPDKCTDRQCILEICIDGRWLTAAFATDGRNPKVFDCEHTAFEAQIEIMVRAATLIAIGRVQPEDLPGPKQFRLKHIDKVPKSYDAEVGDLSHAEAIIRRLQGGLKG